MSQRKVETTAKDLSQMLQAIQTKLKDEHADMLKLLAKKEENQSRLPGAKRKGRKEVREKAPKRIRPLKKTP